MEGNTPNHQPYEEAMPFPLLLEKDFLNQQAMEGKQSEKSFPIPQKPQESDLPFPLVFEERVVWEKAEGAILIHTIDGVTNRTPLGMSSRITSLWTLDVTRTVDIEATSGMNRKTDIRYVPDYEEEHDQ